VLIECEPERQDAVAKRAVEALGEKGRGFEVSAAWGTVSIPAEADEPSEAMQLADVRMYAQKESRRVAYPPVEIDGDEVGPLPPFGNREALEQGQ
jgi:hypothetical protein